MNDDEAKRLYYIADMYSKFFYDYSSCIDEVKTKKHQTRLIPWISLAYPSSPKKQ